MKITDACIEHYRGGWDTHPFVFTVKVILPRHAWRGLPQDKAITQCNQAVRNRYGFAYALNPKLEARIFRTKVVLTLKYYFKDEQAAKKLGLLEYAVVNYL